MKISKKERNLIISEISERMKDLVYITSRSIAKKVLSKIITMITPEKGEDKIDFEYRIYFVVNDLLQIIARHRRLKRRLK